MSEIFSLFPSQIRFAEDRNTLDIHHWNISYMYDLKEYVDFDQLTLAVKKLHLCHEALRLRLLRDQHRWRQYIGECTVDDLPIVLKDLSQISGSQARAYIERETSNIQRHLDLIEGPVILFVYFKCKNQLDKLLIVAHHLVLDFFSFGFLVEDLKALLEQETSSNSPMPATASLIQLNQLLQHISRSDEIEGEIGYWASLPWECVKSIPLDYPQGINTNASSNIVVFAASIEATRSLIRIASKYKVLLNQIILAALALALSLWMRYEYVLIDVVGDLRRLLKKHIDLSRTAGMLITHTPTLLAFNIDSNIKQNIISANHQIANIPNEGIGFDLLRYVSHKGDLKFSKPNVLFNYIGTSSRFIEDDSRALINSQKQIDVTHSPRGLRSHPLAIRCTVAQRQINMTFVYSSNLFDKRTVKEIVGQLESVFGSLVEEDV